MKTLVIAGNGPSGCNLVQNLNRLYPSERFADYGSYFESSSFIVTWVAERLFRISAVFRRSLCPDGKWKISL